MQSFSEHKNNLFIKFQRIKDSLLPTREWSILFSKKEQWIEPIIKGFSGSVHKLFFGDFDPVEITKYNLLVPMTLEDVLILSDLQDLAQRNPIPIPSRDSILLCDDKFMFNETLVNSKFGKHIPTMNKRNNYPYILKKKHDEWGQNSYIISDSADETRLSIMLDSNEYFTQEFILGKTEFATHIIIKDKKLVCSLNIKYIYHNETPIKGKIAPVHTIVCACPYLDLFADILEFIGFEGLCNVNYKVMNGVPYILEINPRFGGSLCPYFFSFIKYL